MSTSTPTTPGRQFFDDHMNFLMSGDVQGMVDAQYASDGILITASDILDEPPPHVIQVGPEMVSFFEKFLAYHGDLQVDDLYDFAELDDTVSFQAKVTSAGGRFVMGEAWHMNSDRKIDRQYTFQYKYD